MKELYVHGIVKDYDKSINSINKYLFSENERLNAIIDDYKERIDKAIDFIKEYGRDKQLEEDYLMSRYNLANYNITLLEILGGEDICHVEEKVKEEDK